MSDEMTPDEFISSCLTVGELVKALLELPQDALVVKFAGGDCDGYIPAGKKKFKERVMYLRSSWNTWDYHGQFDDARERKYVEGSRRRYKGIGKKNTGKDALNYIKKVKAVEL